MELNYKYAESTIKPAALEVAEGSVYFRKEINSITRSSEQGYNTFYWSYPVAQIPPLDFTHYTNLLMPSNTITAKNDSENIVQLMIEQENSDDNQLAIMEAIADLYDAVAAMIPE